MICHFATHSIHKRLSLDTIELWENLVSPFCGIVQNLFVFHRQAFDPKGIAITAQLNQVALFRGIKDSINYHIGGMGMMREEAMKKCLAESYERYIPVIFDAERKFPSFFGSYSSLHEKSQSEFFTNGEPKDLILESETFVYFSAHQYRKENFFTEFNAQTKLNWSRVPELIQKNNIWIPTQLLFFSYLPKTHLGERRINHVVSTGTAVHRNFRNCILNSLLEIIQIDTAIGHWYTGYQAFKIDLTNRTAHLQKIITKSIEHNNVQIEFYWLPQTEFSIFTVICMGKSDRIPFYSFGLGADLSLEAAMYKAYLEFYGTRLLGQSLAILNQEKKVNSAHIQNLDDNVLFYATQKKNKAIPLKFSGVSSVKDSDLPPDLQWTESQIIKILIEQFADTGKNLIGINFTTEESKSLDLVATKLWSPQLLTVPLPSAVPTNHKRFLDYGGIQHDEPHPYA